MERKKSKEKLLLIDANSLIHRAFHALPQLTTPDGAPSGALYGVASILIKIFKERSPEYALAAFDRQEPTFRKKQYEAYKATRPKTDSALIPQIKESHTLFKKFGIKTFELPGWEADDIVATLAHSLSCGEDVQAVIFSGDLDSLQAVEGDKVVVEVPHKGISNTTVYNEAAVIKRFNVKPNQFADYKGLVGDTSDNIPGVPSIGPKTASELICRYGSLENLYSEIEEMGMNNKRLYKTLIDNKDTAILSKKLATLDTNVQVPIRLSELSVQEPLKNRELIGYLKNLGFESLVNRIENDNNDGYNVSRSQGI